MNENVRTIDKMDFYEYGPVLYAANPYCTIVIVDGGSREVHSDSEVV